MTKKKNSYTDEFKQNAVELSKELGIIKAAQELGVSEMSIRNWLKKILSSTSSSRKTETDLLKENKRLQ
ncbi:transposase, partial [Bacteriovorax sp. BAL6_X]|uniref:transposase n=1 Tax=Bacteriovorax sp. BAL6_X TaxID=1201290 RepID=UPI000386553A